MPAVAEESRQVRDLMERVETIEAVANSLPDGDSRRQMLLGVINRDLASASPLRPRIVADLLGLSERTVRSWVNEGVLIRVESASPRMLLDVERVHHVLHLVRDLRAAGQTTGLLDEVHRQLVDMSWLGRGDLTVSLQQMHGGEGTLRVPLPAP